MRRHLEAPLVVGFGVTGRAVAKALIARGHRPMVVDDRPGPESAAAAAAMDLELLGAPSESELSGAVAVASALLPSPGLPDHHPAFRLAREHDVPVLSEFDLARLWDDRPMLAITGTNGKTTVTMMVTEMLNQSGRRAEAVGNTEVPLVAAIDDPTIEIFVVEASSFRLGHSRRFTPSVAAWLNFAPDHLDAHASLDAYEQAKASIWDELADGGLAVANADDPVVMSHAAKLDDRSVRVERFSLIDAVEWRVEASTAGLGHELCGPDGPFLAVSELKRAQPHDVANALAASASPSVAVPISTPSGERWFRSAVYHIASNRSEPPTVSPGTTTRRRRFPTPRSSRCRDSSPSCSSPAARTRACRWTP